MLTELRHVLRGLVRRPAFSLAAILTLGLGIGANSAIFSAVWSLLLDPLPFDVGDRIGWIWRGLDGGMMLTPAAAHLEAFEQNAHSFDALEPYRSETVTLRTDDGVRSVPASRITATMSATLDVQPVLGRTFTQDETRPGGRDVALISETRWSREFGRSPDVLDRSIRLDGREYAIVGVMPDRFTRYNPFETELDIWLPLVRDPAGRYPILAVLKPGVTFADAATELETIAENARAEDDTFGQNWRPLIRTPADMLSPNTRRSLPILFAAVGLVLLIACANVAGLLIVRGIARTQELAIRASLGASRLRLLRFLVLESLALAVLGGGAGLLLGSWGIDLVRALRPAALDELSRMSLDSPVFAFTAVLSALTAVLFGSLPALLATRSGLGSPLQDSTRGSSMPRGAARAGNALVVVEIALAVVLLIAATLVTRTMIHLRNVPLGFDTDAILTMSIDLPPDRYGDAASRGAFMQRLGAAIGDAAGVEAVSLTTGVPTLFGVFFGTIHREGDVEPLPDRVFNGAYIDSNYFRVFGTALIEGRTFAADGSDRDVIIVNRSTARRLWPGSSAVGQRLLMGEGDERTASTIIGVVADAALDGPAAALDDMQLYLPLSSDAFAGGMIAVRTRTADAAPVIRNVRAAVAAVDAELPLRDMALMKDLVASSIGRQRFNMTLLVTFAATALVLAAIGLYGIIAFSVSRRTREIGIRIAVGAAPAGLRRAILVRGLQLAAIGGSIGAVAGIALAGRLARLLSGVEPRDPVSFVAAISLVLATSLVATWVPASRASRLDPLEALRSE